MRPGIGRIRSVFDYEKVGGSILLGVKGTAVITHGRAKRRMIAYACDVTATTARTRVPELIAESLAADRASRAAVAPAPVSAGSPIEPAAPTMAAEPAPSEEVAT
jgi:hypothetical protein